MNVELEQLGERIAEQAAHFDAAMHRLLVDLREFDERGGWHVQGALSCAHWLNWRVGWDLVTARERVRVARKLAEFPTIDDALRRGEVSYSKVRAMLRIATPANELLLLDHARLMTASQLETLCRKYAVVQRHCQDPHPLYDEHRRYVRRRDTDDGMVKIEAVLHPEEAELVWTMLNHAATQLARESDPCAGSDSAESRETAEVLGAVKVAQASMAVNAAQASGAVISLLLSNAVEGQIDDSAESREQPSAPVTTETSSPGHVDSGSTDDSAESWQQSSVPDTSVTALPGCVATCPTDDSAESWVRSSVPDASATASPGCIAAGLTDDSAESWIRSSMRETSAASPGCPATCPTDDSAESRARSSVPDGCVAASPGCPATCPTDDSAESRARSSAPEGCVTASPGCPATCPTDDSAESWTRSSVPDTRVAASPGCIDSCPISDSAESSRFEIPSRSLLDRLLDEADALCSAAAVPCGEPQTSSSSGKPERAPSVLHQRADAAKRAFSRADALISLAQGYLRGDRPNRAPIEITLTIPASSLRSGLAHGVADPVEVGEMGESFVSGEAARRLSCDAGLVEVIEDERGAPLSVGRKRRTIAGALKRALRKRDTSCTYPGCTNRIFLEGHHVKHWADGGETSLLNIALLCSTHHRHVHEYGYTIELDPDQRPRFCDPHGRLVAPVPERPVMADLGWPRIRAMNVPLAIDADTIACEWDGTPPDYRAIVGHFVAADGLQ